MAGLYCFWLKRETARSQSCALADAAKPAVIISAAEIVYSFLIMTCFSIPGGPADGFSEILALRARPAQDAPIVAAPEVQMSKHSPLSCLRQPRPPCQCLPASSKIPVPLWGS